MNKIFYFCLFVFVGYTNRISASQSECPKLYGIKFIDHIQQLPNNQITLQTDASILFYVTQQNLIDLKKIPTEKPTTALVYVHNIEQTVGLIFTPKNLETLKSINTTLASTPSSSPVIHSIDKYSPLTLWNNVAEQARNSKDKTTVEEFNKQYLAARVSSNQSTIDEIQALLEQCVTRSDFESFIQEINQRIEPLKQSHAEIFRNGFVKGGIAGIILGIILGVLAHKFYAAQ